MSITEPGVYDLPTDVYLADPVEGASLSSSGARKLLPPSCPALFHHGRSNPSRATKAFDHGSAAHSLVLGAGPDIVPVDAANWRTKAAKEKAAEARANGCLPLLTADVDTVLAMAKALHAHPIASRLFNTSNGKPEQTLVWRDAETSVWRRALLDWLPERHRGRLIIPDYKTAKSADPEKFAKSAADYGYHQQDAWYLDGVTALGLAEDPAFVFVVQEKDPPYLVNVVELDAIARRIGRYLNRRALHTYAECTRTDTWPGYSDGVELVSLPAWYERQHEDAA